jgi:glycosyltransferase involved in cell wall biosynthesis
METSVAGSAGQLVSIVIPCYNQAAFLGQAIESVLAQTHRNFEIVVVDDGSTDTSMAVARRYEGVRCISQSNQGQGAARNEGLRHVRGTYIVFLDSDDRLLPHALEVGLQCLVPHRECALAAGRCVYIGPDSVRRPTSYARVVDRNHYLNLLISNYIWMPGTAMFRTAVVRQMGGFKTTVSGAEDYDLYLRVARNHRIWCHDQIIAEYRQHDTSTSRNRTLMLRSSLNVLRAQRQWSKPDARATRALCKGIRKMQKVYGEQLMRAVRKHVRAREWRQAIPELLVLLQYYPSGFLHHGRRKLYRMACGHKPDPLDVIG